MDIFRLLFAYTTSCPATIARRIRSTAISSSGAVGEVQFLEVDLKTPLPRKLTFTDP